jgi:hypothetical protein
MVAVPHPRSTQLLPSMLLLTLCLTQNLSASKETELQNFAGFKTYVTSSSVTPSLAKLDPCSAKKI